MNTRCMPCLTYVQELKWLWEFELLFAEYKYNLIHS